MLLPTANLTLKIESSKLAESTSGFTTLEVIDHTNTSLIGKRRSTGLDLGPQLTRFVFPMDASWMAISFAENATRPRGRFLPIPPSCHSTRNHYAPLNWKDTREPVANNLKFLSTGIKCIDNNSGNPYRVIHSFIHYYWTSKKLQ